MRSSPFVNRRADCQIKKTPVPPRHLMEEERSMNSKQNAAHGTWHSPITIEHVVGKAVALHAPTVDGSDVLWVESRPAECGRSVLVRRGPDGNITDITPPPFDVGSTVHGYGGASFAASDGCVVFSHKTDGSVWRMERDEAPQRIAGATGCHFVDFSFLPTNDGGSPRWVLAIREDHRRSETEPRAAIVALCLTESTAEPVGRVLVEGPDFLSSPRPSPDGKFLAWISWNHPDMPWDATQLMRASFRQGGSSDQVPTLKTIEQLLGQQRESVIQPGWTVKNELLACSDRSSWWNLYRIDGIEAITPLCPKEAEIGEPHWVFGDRSWWPLPDGNIVAVAISDGRRTPGLIADGAWTVLSLGGRSEPRVRACPIPVAENHWIWLKAERDAPPAIMLDDTALRKSSAQEFISAALHEVNRITGFASAFTNLRTTERCDDVNALLAAILADATNLGLGRMAAASHGVTRDKLIWTADAYIRPDTYKAALARIIDAHHALPIACTWGDGTTSSSDRQFFRSAKRGDAAGEVNARYGHDPGLGFYTHVSDQHGPYSVRVMSATSHEAPYVLDGLMHHGTALRVGTHYTDTGGASDHVFILCAMLGFRFCPRLRDLPDRKLATIEPATAYKDLAPLIGRRIKADVIRDHWGEILRLVASLQAGTVLPSAMLKRLSAFQRQNQLDLALQELGRVERTLFMLDWLESPDLRQRCQAGLNKSEQRHVLAQVICTFKQGRIADRGHEAQQFRASGLNLVIAAIVYWNSTYLADAVQHLRDQGKPVPDVLLAHTSPLTWEHIGFSGDFLWDRAAATADRRRPLNLGRNRIAA